MSPRRSRVARACVPMLIGIALLCAPSSVRPQAPMSGKPADEKPTPPLKLEDLQLPAEAIIVLCERAADSFKAIPKFYLLTPEQMAAHEEEVKRLLKQLQARQPAPVSEWKVEGKVKGNHAELKIQFVVVTSQPKAHVVLGCRQGFATAVTLDNEAPAVWPVPEGLAVEVPTAGKHDIVVNLVIGLKESQLPADRRPPSGEVQPGDTLLGFELDLPLSGVTGLELELPGGTRYAEVNDQSARDPVTLEKNLLSGPLGKAKSVKVAWKGPAAAASVSAPVLLAKGKLIVRIDQRFVSTEAEITLTGSTKKWELRVPKRATVRLANPADRALLDGDIRGSGSEDGKITIGLRNPATAPLTVVVSVSQSRDSGPLSLGPFAVVGALKHTGVVWVVASGNQRARIDPVVVKGPRAFDITPRRLDERGKPEDADRPPDATAAYQYWSFGDPENAWRPEAWFQLDLTSLQGSLDIRLSHAIRLTPPSSGTGSVWRVVTTLDAKPIRSGVDRLEMRFPAPWQFDRERGPRPPSIEPVDRDGSGPGVIRFDLAPEALKPFELKLEAQAGGSGPMAQPFPEAPGHEGASVVIPLPRPSTQSVRNGGPHEITVQVPGHLDLRVAQPPNQPGMELVGPPEAHKLVWRADKFPDQLAIAWKPHRPELRIDSVADVHPRPGRTRVLQRLEFTFGEADTRTTGRDVTLRLPASAEGLSILSGGRDADSRVMPGGDPDKKNQTTRFFLQTPPLRAGQPEVRPHLLLEYFVPVAAGGEATISLAGPVDATAGELRVRVWGESGGRVHVPPPPWEDAPLEVVPDQDRLPSLVLRAPRPWPPLPLRYDPPAPESGGGGVLADRALIQVRLTEGGFQQYRVRLVLRRVSTNQLEMTFPAALSSLDLSAYLDGRPVNCSPVEPVPGGAEPKEGTRTARVGLTDLKGKPAVLELQYRLPPGRSGEGGALWSRFQPPSVQGLLTAVPTRWAIDLPGDWLPLSLEAGTSTGWAWERRGWLFALRPDVTAGELEEWLLGEGAEERLREEEAGLWPAFTAWRGGLSSVTVFHIPQQAWLLGSSLLLLLVGLTLSGVARGKPRTRRLFWPFVALHGLAVAAVGLLWPGMLAAFLYGWQPGAAVLLVFLLIQLLVHRRYRRRVVFLPGFRRVKAGSSLVRTTGSTPHGRAAVRSEEAVGGSNGSRTPYRTRAEPSTVDAPDQEPPAGSD